MRHASLVLLALTAVALACAEQPAEEEAPATEEAQTEEMSTPGAVAADPAHYGVEFENDAIRVLRIAYGPGERSVMHHHPESCAVPLTSSSWNMSLGDGSTVEEVVEAGEVRCYDAGDHLPENMTDEPAEVILVEFKEGATPGSGTESEHPGAVAADPDHYSVAFENDIARVVEIDYGAGETSTMHHHPANCIVFLEFQPTTMELPTGEIVEMTDEVEPGTVQCGDAEAHLPTNLGDGETRVVVVELKGRETLTR